MAPRTSADAPRPWPGSSPRPGTTPAAFRDSHSSRAQYRHAPTMPAISTAAATLPAWPSITPCSTADSRGQSGSGASRDETRAVSDGHRRHCLSRREIALNRRPQPRDQLVARHRDDRRQLQHVPAQRQAEHLRRDQAGAARGRPRRSNFAIAGSSWAAKISCMRCAASAFVVLDRSSTTSASSSSQRSRKCATSARAESGPGRRPTGRESRGRSRPPRRTAGPCCRSSASPSTGRCWRRRRSPGWWRARSPIRRTAPWPRPGSRPWFQQTIYPCQQV